MNHYPHHLGDYAKKTLGFTQGEHGAYRLLLDAYYATEKALPAEDVYTIAKATNAAERKNTDKALKKFDLRDGHYHHERAEEELAAYRARAETARENGKKPKKKPAGNPSAYRMGKPEQSESDTGSVSGIEAESNLTSNHKPEEPKTKKERTSASSTAPATTERAFPPPKDSRVEALQALLDTHELQAPRLALQQWVCDGVTEEILRAALDRGRQRKAGAPFNFGFLQLMVTDVRAAGVGYDSNAVIAETIAAVNAKESPNAAH